ncbi:MAG: PAS domain S-box protein [Bacteroidota bacterium]
MSDDLAFDLLNKLPLGILVYHLEDPEDPGSLRLVQANKAASVALGFDVRPDLGRTIREASSQALGTDHAAAYASVALTGEARDLGAVEYGDDRVERGVFRVCAFPLRGRRVGVLFEEVSRRQSNERRLRLLTSAVENARDSVVITDARLDEPGPEIVYANAAFTRLTGYTLAEVLGRNPRFLQGPETERAVLDRLRACLEAGESFSGETYNYRKDGTPFVMDWEIDAIRDSGGRVTHWVATQRDVTERRRAAARLAERTDDLAGFSEDLKLLHRITTTRHETAAEAFQAYLRTGCEIFEMPIGILSETPVVDEATGERSYRLRTVESPVPEVHAGIEMPLRESFCDAVVERGTTVSYADVSAEDDSVTCKAAHAEHGLRAFIGTPLVVDGALFGTLNFVSPEPRPEGFAAHEHELVEVMAESVVQLLSLERAEAARREADARIRSVVETVEEGLMMVDAEGRVLMSNPAAQEMLGLDERMVFERVAGLPRWRLLREDGSRFPDDDLPEREVLRTGRPVSGVVQGVVKPSGETCWYSVNARAADRAADGAVVSVVLSFSDVTEQRQAEADLRESEAQLQKAQEIAHIGSWHWDIESNDLTWSDEMFRIFGLEPDAIKPKLDSAIERLHPDDREPIRVLLARTLEHKSSYEINQRVVHPDGRLRHIHALGATVLDAGGEAVGIQGTAQDVTEQVEAEAALQRYADQLEERNAELEQFAYVASHDLQEPLRMVSSFLQLLQRRYGEQLDDTADEYIAYAVDGAKRMQKLIQDLLAYSRVGTRGKAFRPIDMNELARTVQTDLSQALADHGATVEVGTLPTVSADETQMRQLLQNLVANAVKFRAEAAPVVRVSADEVEDGGRRVWRFAVADNGIGIEPQHAERVFQIFQRLHTRDEYEGTGIGLAMCKKIVERHGGRIWFESAPDAAQSATEGTTFYFTLPTSPFPSGRTDG